jgi:TRAP-type C4-dicarboxylate transport system substrate-binding protein
MDFEEIEWEKLDDDERQVVRARMRAETEEGRRSAEMYKDRALRMIEKLGVEGLGEALAAQLEGMSTEEFIFKFDSTLSNVLSTVTAVRSEVRRDTVPS